jgi:hypothetical protein
MFQDPELLFHEPTHAYTYRGKALTSVTTFLKRFYEQFDSDYHSVRIAERDGTTQQLVLDLWARKAAEAADLGTAVHAFAEGCAGGPGLDAPLSDEAMGYARGVVAWYACHPELSKPGGLAIPEVRVALPEAGLAGTIDLICHLEGEPAIIDWKTTRSISYTGFRNLLPPVDHLPESSFWIYALQLNTYAHILRDRYEYDARRLAVVWLGPAGTHREMRIPLLDDCIDRMLEAG